MKKMWLLMVFVLVLSACGKLNITGQAVKEIKTEPNSVSFGDMLKLDGNYKCNFYNLNNPILYTSKGNYRLEFNKAHVLGIRTIDGGLCISYWEDKSDTVLKNCITRDQYNALWNKIGLHNINPGDAQIPPYSTKVECQEHYYSIDFNLPNLKIIDLSNFDSSTSHAVLTRTKN